MDGNLIRPGPRCGQALDLFAGWPNRVNFGVDFGIAFVVQFARGCAEMRGPLDRGPRVCEFCGPRTAGGRICWTADRALVRLRSQAQAKS